MRILILGAGGQGQVLADALLFAAEAGQPVTPVGYLDDNPALWQMRPLGLPVLGPLAAWRVAVLHRWSAHPRPATRPALANSLA